MSKMSFENHIMKQFDEELEEIRTRLMAMGGKVEQQLQNAIRAVTEADSALAESVIKEEKFVDEMEVDIDEACILIIATSYVFINFLTEVAYRFLDPRMRH